MAESIVFHAAAGGQVDVHGFNDNIVLSLKLPAGRYAVWARAVVANGDGDFQQGSLSLKTRRSLSYIDRNDFGMVENDESPLNALNLSLQGVVFFEEDDLVDLTAGTYNGGVFQARIMALLVDDIIPPV